jgi:hypothetical protein
LLYSDTNLAILKHIQIPSLCGKLSSVILQMAPRLLLINSYVVEKPNGTSRMALLCFCHTAMMVKAQSIPHAELKDTWSYVTKMNSSQKTVKITTTLTFWRKSTCKFAILQQLPIISICSEHIWDCHSENH